MMNPYPLIVLNKGPKTVQTKGWEQWYRYISDTDSIFKK